MNYPVFPAAAMNVLLEWGRVHQRQYPWRFTGDAYRVFVAEILLHRTRADQVEPVYRAFLTKYPDISALVHAQTNELEALLQPLGLRWRIPLLQAACLIIARDYQGKIPRDRATLEHLPGVGPYIAGAVLCFQCSRASS